jgi:HJR/Mrr/RecB family endonuclease
MAKASFYDKADKKLRKVAGTIGAIVAILGALTGAFSWASSQFTNAISAQINDFREEAKASDKATKQATTRLELMILMEHDSENIIAIEKMAKYYFQELDGDLYMTQKVSDWCKANNRDCTVLIGGK